MTKKKRLLSVLSIAAASIMLAASLSACGGVPKDDMTVMCAHIGKG